MIAQQAFGRTGHLSSRVILGAAAFGEVSQAETDQALELALAAGVNHVDVAASYGQAEDRLGDWIHRHGRPFFLATKTGERTAEKASQEIQRSLERLQIDQVDLIQLHNLVEPDEWETALGPGGALEAAVKAREQGLVRFIGVTGHGVTAASMHLRALQAFDFDSVLLPYSYMMAQNASYRDAFMQLLSVCQARNVAMQTIKSIVQRPWGQDAQNYATWYKPLEDQKDIDLAVHFVFGQPGIFLNSAGDVYLLPKVLEAASRFQSAPTEADMQSLRQQLDMQPLFF